MYLVADPTCQDRMKDLLEPVFNSGKGKLRQVAGSQFFSIMVDLYHGQEQQQVLRKARIYATI